MRAVIYGRYSDVGQREESIEGQLRECKDYANQKDITIVDTYIDRALSASKDTDKRLAFQKMIRDSAKGLFDIIIVWKLDRFARSRYDSAHYKNILKKNGVKVVSATEAISDSPEGIILESLLEGMAEYYSAELSSKVKRGQKENALKGKINGGSCPFGYVINKDLRLEIDPINAPIAIEVFERYANGELVDSITKSLNERGLLTSKKKPFTKSTFNRMLTNRKYIGEYRYSDIIIPNSIPPLISEELFNRVQERKEKNRRTPSRSKAKEIYLLTTKLFCGSCGYMLAGESGTSKTGDKHYYYKCSNAKRKMGCHRKAIKKAWIENIVVEFTAKMILDDELLERIIDKLQEIQGKENPDIAILKTQIAEIEKNIENMLKAIQAGIITPSTKERLEELEANKIELEDKLVIAKIKNPLLTREEISFFIYKFRQLDVGLPEHRERLVDSFVNSVYVYDDKIVLTYNYKDFTETIGLEDIQSSFLENPGAPKIKTGNLSVSKP